jgi:hypothetical protein
MLPADNLQTTLTLCRSLAACNGPVCYNNSQHAQQLPFYMVHLVVPRVNTAYFSAPSGRLLNELYLGYKRYLSILGFPKRFFVQCAEHLLHSFRKHQVEQAQYRLSDHEHFYTVLLPSAREDASRNYFLAAGTTIIWRNHVSQNIKGSTAFQPVCWQR